MRRALGIMVGLVVALVAAAGPAPAQVSLRFTPPDTTVFSGDRARLGLYLDDAIDVRTVTVTVTFDTVIVQSVTGTPGSLFTDSGHFLFHNFDPTEPGRWQGDVVVMSSGQSVMGPGELYSWEYEGRYGGTTPVVAVTAWVSDRNGEWYPAPTLDPTTINVDGPASAALPTVTVPALRLSPNPFNPRARLEFELDSVEVVRLEVFDVRGRLVSILHDGPAPAGPFSAAWDGRDREGHAASGGVYLFRLVTPRGTAFTRGVLLE